MGHVTRMNESCHTYQAICHLRILLPLLLRCIVEMHERAFPCSILAERGPEFFFVGATHPDFSSFFPNPPKHPNVSLPDSAD